MAEVSIRLENGEWFYDPDAQLGQSGGFGAVFCGRGADGTAVAVKRLHIEAATAAHRELRIADELRGRQPGGAIPILDSGLDANSDQYFVVMALAEGSLHDYLVANGVPPLHEAIAILIQIALGLEELADVVHRDLKPANVLRYQGRWRIADFGIAKFVEDATSVLTLNRCLTPAYAAPEQWREERCTNATDVYALGCIAYQLFTGRLPFTGPGPEEFRAQHLQNAPPSLEISSRLGALVTQMLRKSPAVRPPIARVISVLRLPRDTSPHRRGSDRLADVNAVLTQERARADAAAAQRERIREERNAMEVEAAQNLEEIAQQFKNHIGNSLSVAAYNRSQAGYYVHHKWACREADLLIAVPVPGLPAFGPDSLNQRGWDLICGGTVQVTMHQPRQFRRSSSLWFGNIGGSDGYRWWEVAYYNNPLMGRGQANLHEPFAIQIGDYEKAYEVAGPGMHVLCTAFGPKAIDLDMFEEFVERWAAIFADALSGRLSTPSHLPL